MAQKAHVPKFGNWESDDNVPYTQCFDNARIGNKNGGKFNPNDPYENPDGFGDSSPAQVRATKMKPKFEDLKMKSRIPPSQHMKYESELEDQKAKDWQYKNKGNSNNHRPPFHHDSRPWKPASSPPRRQYGDKKSGDQLQKPNRTYGGYELNFNPSPPQHKHQTKSGNKGGVSSSSWEKRGSGEAGYGFASNTPSMPKMRPVNGGNETNGKTSIVPKFGDWNECDPSSADGYSQIFNKMKEEKQTSSAKVPVISHDPIRTDRLKKDKSPKSTSCGCFGICSK